MSKSVTGQEGTILSSWTLNCDPKINNIEPDSGVDDRHGDPRNKRTEVLQVRSDVGTDCRRSR